MRDVANIGSLSSKDHPLLTINTLTTGQPSISFSVCSFQVSPVQGKLLTMSIKQVIIVMAVGVLVVCNAGAIPVGIPGSPFAVPAAVPLTKVVDPGLNYDPHPQYTYAYDVQDALTGDSKSQHESRNGDVVSGSYSFIEADGTRRIVEYTADPINGFNAVVHREPVAVVKPVVKVAAPLPYHL